jgi:NAD(P)H dehydrogenase (quinone)
MSKILVTGSTGHLGKATIEHLVQRTSADQHVAFARNESKTKDLLAKGIEVRYGNFDDVDSLDKAMRGIDKVLLVSTVDHHRYQQHRNVVDAAKRAGVTHIGYTSAAIKEISTSQVKSHLESHFQTEDYIKASGLSYSIFRNTLYADVIPMYVGEKVFERGIYLPAGDGKVAYALRSEMGEGMANALLQSSKQSNIYELTGNELYSYHDIAQVFSQIADKTVTYTNADASTFPDKLRQLGLPDRTISIASGFATDIRNHQYEFITNDLEKLLERKPATLLQALRLIYAS